MRCNKTHAQERFIQLCTVFNNDLVHMWLKDTWHLTFICPLFNNQSFKCSAMVRSWEMCANIPERYKKRRKNLWQSALTTSISEQKSNNQNFASCSCYNFIRTTESHSRTSNTRTLNHTKQIWHTDFQVWHFKVFSEKLNILK